MHEIKTQTIGHSILTACGWCQEKIYNASCWCPFLSAFLMFIFFYFSGRLIIPLTKNISNIFLKILLCQHQEMNLNLKGLSSQDDTACRLVPHVQKT